MATPRAANFPLSGICGRLNPTNNYPNGCAKSQHFSQPGRRWHDGFAALAEAGEGL